MSSLAGNIREWAAKQRGWGLYASHIGPNGSYMRRWILRTPFGMLRLHHILRSDTDRHLHDHPFDFVSFLLTGGYHEAVPCPHCDRFDGTNDGCYRCKEGLKTQYWPRFSVVRKRAEDLHRLTLDKPIWTLVFSGLKRREWGFQTENGWVPASNYQEMWSENG